MTYEEYIALDVDARECRSCGRVMSMVELEGGTVCFICRPDYEPIMLKRQAD